MDELPSQSVTSAGEKKTPTLVPNRECGECTACCTYLSIDTPELQKLPSATCIHCDDKKGCGIHLTRPPICREYFCVWRLANMFDDSWRPDRSGVLMTFRESDIPLEYIQEGFELLLIDPAAALAKAGLFKFIVRAVANRVPVFLCLPGAPGFDAAGVLINPLLEAPVAQHDNKAIKGIVEAIVKRLGAGPFKRVTLKYLKK